MVLMNTITLVLIIAGAALVLGLIGFAALYYLRKKAGK